MQNIFYKPGQWLNNFIDVLYWLLLKLKYPLQNLLISFLLINFLFLYGTADYSQYTERETFFWNALWYVIEAWLYVLFALGFTALNHRKSYRAIWAILALFLTIRAVWEISAVLSGVSVNEKIVISRMFYLTCAVIFIIAFSPYVLKLINLCRKLLSLLGRWLSGLASR